jgi:plastocyanin
MRRFALGMTLALGVALALAGCGDDDSDDSDAGTEGGNGATGDAVAYEVTDISYTDVTAPAGGTIEISNTSGAPHTFTADDDSFDVEYGADGTATVDVPADPGEYSFHCEVHPSMQATLTVE